MPEQRLAQTRGECRCPEGVCLYRSGNQPGYCRQDATRRARCPAQAPTPGIFCDRELGHEGSHRGYLKDQDAVVFWVGPSFTTEHPAKCPMCGAYPYRPVPRQDAADRYRDHPPASSQSFAHVPVGDIDHPTLCFVQQTDPTKPHVMWRCDRTKGHIGPHSWDVR